MPKWVVRVAFAVYVFHAELATHRATKRPDSTIPIRIEIATRIIHPQRDLVGSRSTTNVRIAEEFVEEIGLVHRRFSGTGKRRQHQRCDEQTNARHGTPILIFGSFQQKDAGMCSAALKAHWAVAITDWPLSLLGAMEPYGHPFAADDRPATSDGQRSWPNANRTTSPYPVVTAGRDRLSLTLHSTMPSGHGNMTMSMSMVAELEKDTPGITAMVVCVPWLGWFWRRFEHLRRKPFQKAISGLFRAR